MTRRMKESPDNIDFENELDTQLMWRIREGDTHAMESLIRRHQDVVYATISGMLRKQGDIEDIAQQVFIRIWRSASTYEPSAKFKTWMFTILRNLVFNEMRRKRRKPVLSSDALEEENGMILSIDSALSPDEAADQSELEQAVNQAIDELSPKEKLALQLRRYENMPYEEIATVLETSVSATKSILFRARNQLKEKLSHFLGN
ncbi:MAG: sigma-70 family RNA polymerase sigma factor [Akkermansia sp.]